MTIFENMNLGKVRVITDGVGNPWFCLMDVCEIMGLSNPTMVSEKLFENEVTKFNLGRYAGATTFVNQSGLYAVILKSRKPIAQQFRYWITSEVLPSIAKSGYYSSDEEFFKRLDNDLEFYIKFHENYLAYKRELLEARKKIEILTPSAEKFNNWLEGKELYPVRFASHIMGIKGMGLKNLFKYFRENGYVSQENVAFQTFIDQKHPRFRKGVCFTNGNNLNESKRVTHRYRKYQIIPPI